MVDQASDRRAGERSFTCYPIHIQKGEIGETSEVELAVIEDLSASGALLLARDQVPVGSRVKLHLDVFGEADRIRIATGRVVRVESRPPERSEVWPFSVAVQFDVVHTDLEAAIVELARAIRPRTM